jgi:hypothetical protein
MLRFWLDYLLFGCIKFFEYGWMVFLLVSFRFLVAMLFCLLGYSSYIARHLAAKFGTYSWLSPYMSSLPMSR